MQIFRNLAGYSLGRSDLVRRAMSKKKKEVMDAERQNFIHGSLDENGNILIPGAIRNGVSEYAANVIFDEMMDFASYAFNKSHAAAYAYVGYQTAWLKYYYPVEFMAALINSYMGSLGKVSQYVMECRKMGIKVLPPDINESESSFSVKNGVIRFGLLAVKNVGVNIVHNIIEERNKNGVFKNFIDFCERLEGKELNKKTVESLIKCGAFDIFGIYRSRLIANYEKILERVSQKRKSMISGQLSLFDVVQHQDTDDTAKVEWPQMAEYDSKLLLSMEKEMLGLYISGHPLDEFADVIKEMVTVYSYDFEISEDGSSNENRLSDGSFVRIAGIVTDIKSISTKNNRMMAFVTVEDLYGQMEVVVFPNIYERFARFLSGESQILVEGKISLKEDEQPKILADRIRPLESINNEIHIDDSDIKEEYGQFNQNGISESNGMSGNNNIKEENKYYKTEKAARKTNNNSIAQNGVLKVLLDKEITESKRKAALSVLKYFEGHQRALVYIDEARRPKLKLNVQISDLLISELTELLGSDRIKI